jgi:hypothetical protein
LLEKETERTNKKKALTICSLSSPSPLPLATPFLPPLPPFSLHHLQQEEKTKKKAKERGGNEFTPSERGADNQQSRFQ